MLDVTLFCFHFEPCDFVPCDFVPRDRELQRAVNISVYLNSGLKSKIEKELTVDIDNHPSRFELKGRSHLNN